jgi:type IV pilus assembly protein PilE
MKNKKGFTMGELLVVVIIIGVLTGAGVAQYTSFIKKSRALEALTTARSMAESANRFYGERGTYSGMDIALNLDIKVNKKNFGFFTNIDGTSTEGLSAEATNVTAIRLNSQGAPITNTADSNYFMLLFYLLRGEISFARCYGADQGLCKSLGYRTCVTSPQKYCEMQMN